MELEEDPVVALFNKSFSVRSLAEKCETLGQGRPKPTLATRPGGRSFRPQWYTDFD